MSKFVYENKIAIVTGASSGIGKEICKILIEEYGAKVIAIARNEKKLLDLKNSSEKISKNLTYQLFDVGVKENWQKFYSYLKNENIIPDILINCAGVLPPFKKVEDTTVEEFEKVLNTNFLSQVYSINVLLPIIKSKGDGLIINVSSSSSLCTFGGISMYSASKSASSFFTQSLICEEPTLKISLALPGTTKTDIFNNQKTDEKAKGVIDKIALSPYKVAKTILKKARKGKKRIIVGFDAKLMNFLYKVFPTLAPKIITKFLKNTKYKIFDNM